MITHSKLQAVDFGVGHHLLGAFDGMKPEGNPKAFQEFLGERINCILTLIWKATANQAPIQKAGQAQPSSHDPASSAWVSQ